MPLLTVAKSEDKAISLCMPLFRSMGQGNAIGRSRVRLRKFWDLSHKYDSVGWGMSTPTV